MEKQTWQAPELKELPLEQTQGGSIVTPSENATYQFTISIP
jgi:hypothetical protein